MSQSSAKNYLMRNKLNSYLNYNIDLDTFKFCVRKKCPFRKTCLRKVEPSFNYEYYTTGGSYDKVTNTCKEYINKNEN